MGCNMSAGADKVCESLKAALEKEQISVSVLDNVLYDAEAMEKMDAMPPFPFSPYPRCTMK